MYQRGQHIVQGYMDLAIITAGAKANVRAPCKFNLIAKDGVYPMKIPREVDSLVLAAGNRCSAAARPILPFTQCVYCYCSMISAKAENL